METEVGETVTAAYAIAGGSGEYAEIQIGWEQKVAGSAYWTGGGTGSTANGDDIPETGTWSYTPAIGEELRLAVFVKDTQSRSNSAESDIVTVSKAVPDFILPSETGTIGKDAFYGIAAKTVLVPDGTTKVKIDNGAFSYISTLRLIYLPYNVTEIADYAFENTNCIIFTPKNSFAENWAKLHGIEYRNASVNDIFLSGSQR